MNRFLKMLQRCLRLRPIQPCAFDASDRSDVALIISMAEQLEAQQR
ncbi:hypothetical protein RBSH_01924 [Rhodopirellula baltica SH28]|uniref:Uncharacterized protein n=1 Tax=Rhodopirellula baltica SH28 TaxID=993517 RepID=K5DIW6_RHOBT|nr:hypothetical protein RBSH_01924 [Rhodopirellula baltica SH28]